MRQSEQTSEGSRTQGFLSVMEQSKQLSRSSISSKSQSGEASLQTQIVQLKEKAHQSFMQVIQMQQLHEEELEVLRSEFLQREREYEGRIAELEARSKLTEELELRVKQLEYENVTLEKNYKHHICDFEQDDLSIDNIELITYQEESRLDESSIINFEEIISLNRHEERLGLLREEIQGELRRAPADSRLGPCVDELFEYIQFIKKEFLKVQEKHGEREREREASQSAQHSKFYESLQKEAKFMSEHIKRLSAEKLKAEKKLVEAEREHRALEDKIRQIEASLAKRGIKLDQEILHRHKSPQQEHQKSLEINQFIVENFKKTSNPNPISKTRYGLTIKNKN